MPQVLSLMANPMRKNTLKALPVRFERSVVYAMPHPTYYDAEGVVRD